MQFTDQNIFLKKLLDQVDDVMDKLYLSKGIHDVIFHFVSCQEIRKWYVVTSIHNLHTHTHTHTHTHRQTHTHTHTHTHTFQTLNIELKKLWAEFQKLIKKFQAILKVQTIYRLNFLEVENFHKVECRDCELLAKLILFKKHN